MIVVPGKHRGYDVMSGLLTLSIATGVSYAVATAQLPNSSATAGWFYIGTTLVVLALIGIVINSRSGTTQTGSTSERLRFRDEDVIDLYYDRSTTCFANLVSISCILLCIVFISAGRAGYFPWQQAERIDFPHDEILCSEPALATLPSTPVSPTGNQQSGDRADAMLLERFKRWFGVFMEPQDEKQILIVQMAKPFEADYNTFSAVMLFRKPQVVFSDALVFLKKSSPQGGFAYSLLSAPRSGDAQDAVNFEQLQIPRDQDTSYPVITIANPNKGDSLIIFALVQAPPQQPMQARLKLESDPSWFQFRLRRVQK